MQNAKVRVLLKLQLQVLLNMAVNSPDLVQKSDFDTGQNFLEFHSLVPLLCTLTMRRIEGAEIELDNQDM